MGRPPQADSGIARPVGRSTPRSIRPGPGRRRSWAAELLWIGDGDAGARRCRRDDDPGGGGPGDALGGDRRGLAGSQRWPDHGDGLGRAAASTGSWISVAATCAQGSSTSTATVAAGSASRGPIPTRSRSSRAPIAGTGRRRSSRACSRPPSSPSPTTSPRWRSWSRRGSWPASTSKGPTSPPSTGGCTSQACCATRSRRRWTGSWAGARGRSGWRRWPRSIRTASTRCAGSPMRGPSRRSGTPARPTTG